MKSILRFVGMVVFWAAWPFWFVYFKLNHHRSRVLVVVGDEVLLLRGWLGNGAWGLPGGGVARHETVAASAVRELYEEVRIEAAESALRYFGKRRHTELGLDYRAEYYALELSEKPDIKLLWHEISDAKWVAFAETPGLHLDYDTAYALRKYRPLDQTELL